MQTLNPIDPATASGKAKEVFDILEQRIKAIPNMIRLMANSAAIVDAYLQFNQAFEHTKVTRKMLGLITATVSEINGCDYTLSTTVALGRNQGVTEDEINRARRAESGDPRTAVALRFAAKAVRERGRVASTDVEELRQAGYSDEEIVEIIAAVALSIFRNYFNLIAGTEIDFPLVKTNRAA